MRKYAFLRAGEDPRRVPVHSPAMPGDKDDPDFLHSPDGYDTDFIWDGETLDEEKI